MAGDQPRGEPGIGADNAPHEAHSAAALLNCQKIELELLLPPGEMVAETGFPDATPRGAFVFTWYKPASPGVNTA